jgi:hypothetical protein
VTAISDELLAGAERILAIHARDNERGYAEKELLDRINRSSTSRRPSCW